MVTMELITASNVSHIGAEEDSAMIIVGFGMALIAATVFFTWHYFRKWSAAWRAKRARVSRVRYYQVERTRRDSERDHLRPAAWRS
jgi:hypothetical protein